MTNFVSRRLSQARHSFKDGREDWKASFRERGRDLRQSPTAGIRQSMGAASHADGAQRPDTTYQRDNDGKVLRRHQRSVDGEISTRRDTTKKRGSARRANLLKRTAPTRTRTLNLLIKSQLLCQLSYRGGVCGILGRKFLPHVIISANVTNRKQL